MKKQGNMNDVKNENGKNGMPPKPPKRKGMLKRILKLLFGYYKPMLIVVIICILLTSIASTVASLFMNRFLEYINQGLK